MAEPDAAPTTGDDGARMPRATPVAAPASAVTPAVIADLRSDTVTRPGPAMLAAMSAAEVGDDVYGEDPTVNALQEEVAARFGHEAALFTPTGSMANQIALQLLVPPGSEVICDADAHIVNYELGAAAALGGISSRTWPASGGRIDVDLVSSMIKPAGYFTVDTRAIAVEQTHNRAGGQVIPFETLRRLRTLADRAGVALHCDGARIWHAAVSQGVSFEEYGRLFDTVSVCLSKGLGAPVGSLVIGPAEQIDRARWIRKRLGGGMRQAGVIAAAGRYALEHHVERLAEDHARAARLADALGAPVGDTNMVLLDLSVSTLDDQAIVAAARAEGVLFGLVAPRTARLVTHLDLDDEQLDHAIEVLRKLLAG